MDVDRPVVADLVAEVATAVSRRAAEVSQDVCKLILREIPQLDDDKPVVALLASSVDSNVGTCLQILQHRIDLTAVQAPASAVEYARRLAQRGTPLTALLRAYRLGHTCFSDWLLRELAEHTRRPRDDHRDRAEHGQAGSRVYRPGLRGDGRGLHQGAGELAAELQRRPGRTHP